MFTEKEMEMLNRALNSCLIRADEFSVYNSAVQKLNAILKKAFDEENQKAEENN